MVEQTNETNAKTNVLKFPLGDIKLPFNNAHLELPIETNPPKTPNTDKQNLTQPNLESENPRESSDVSQSENDPSFTKMICTYPQLFSKSIFTPTFKDYFSLWDQKKENIERIINEQEYLLKKIKHYEKNLRAKGHFQ